MSLVHRGNSKYSDLTLALHQLARLPPGFPIEAWIARGGCAKIAPHVLRNIRLHIANPSKMVWFEINKGDESWYERLRTEFSTVTGAAPSDFYITIGDRDYRLDHPAVKVRLLQRLDRGRIQAVESDRELARQFPMLRSREAIVRGLCGRVKSLGSPSSSYLEACGLGGGDGRSFSPDDIWRRRRACTFGGRAMVLDMGLWRKQFISQLGYQLHLALAHKEQLEQDDWHIDDHDDDGSDDDEDGSDDERGHSHHDHHHKDKRRAKALKKLLKKQKRLVRKHGKGIHSRFYPLLASRTLMNALVSKAMRDESVYHGVMGVPDEKKVYLKWSKVPSYVPFFRAAGAHDVGALHTSMVDIMTSRLHRHVKKRDRALAVDHASLRKDPHLYAEILGNALASSVNPGSTSLPEEGMGCLGHINAQKVLIDVGILNPVERAFKCYHRQHAMNPAWSSRRSPSSPTSVTIPYAPHCGNKNAPAIHHISPSLLGPSAIHSLDMAVTHPFARPHHRSHASHLDDDSSSDEDEGGEDQGGSSGSDSDSEGAHVGSDIGGDTTSIGRSRQKKMKKKMRKMKKKVTPSRDQIGDRMGGHDGDDGSFYDSDDEKRMYHRAVGDELDEDGASTQDVGAALGGRVSDAAQKAAGTLYARVSGGSIDLSKSMHDKYVEGIVEGVLDRNGYSKMKTGLDGVTPAMMPRGAFQSTLAGEQRFNAKSTATLRQIIREQLATGRSSALPQARYQIVFEDPRFDPNMPSQAVRVFQEPVAGTYSTPRSLQDPRAYTVVKFNWVSPTTKAKQVVLTFLFRRNSSVREMIGEPIGAAVCATDGSGRMHLAAPPPGTDLGVLLAGPPLAYLPVQLEWLKHLQSANNGDDAPKGYQYFHNLMSASRYYNVLKQMPGFDLALVPDNASLDEWVRVMRTETDRPVEELSPAFFAYRQTQCGDEGCARLREMNGWKEGMSPEEWSHRMQVAYEKKRASNPYVKHKLETAFEVAKYLTENFDRANQHVLQILRDVTDLLAMHFRYVRDQKCDVRDEVGAMADGTATDMKPLKSRMCGRVAPLVSRHGQRTVDVVERIYSVVPQNCSNAPEKLVVLLKVFLVPHGERYKRLFRGLEDDQAATMHAAMAGDPALIASCRCRRNKIPVLGNPNDPRYVASSIGLQLSPLTPEVQPDGKVVAHLSVIGLPLIGCACRRRSSERHGNYPIGAAYAEYDFPESRGTALSTLARPQEEPVPVEISPNDPEALARAAATYDIDRVHLGNRGYVYESDLARKHDPRNAECDEVDCPAGFPERARCFRCRAHRHTRPNWLYPHGWAQPMTRDESLPPPGAGSRTGPDTRSSASSTSYGISKSIGDEMETPYPEGDPRNKARQFMRLWDREGQKLHPRQSSSSDRHILVFAPSTETMDPRAVRTFVAMASSADKTQLPNLINNYTCKPERQAWTRASGQRANRFRSLRGRVFSYADNTLGGVNGEKFKILGVFPHPERPDVSVIVHTALHSRLPSEPA